MSIWTHVAAVIRADGFRYDEEDFDKLIGKEISFFDESDKWEYAFKHRDEFMPFGSEGGLTKVIWKNPEKSSAALYTITIFGDLRRYDNVDEIIEWFKKVCSKFWIRQACITCNNGIDVKTLNL